MSINEMCAICGGYVKETVVSTLSSSSNPRIRYCPGHQTTDADLASHFPHHIMCTGVGPELVALPKGSSVYPTGQLEQEKTMWEIVKQVAEESPLHGQAGRYYCNYCEGRDDSVHLILLASNFENPDDAREQFISQFPHEPTCIVTKARELMEWRKAQPQVTASIKKDSE